MPESRRQEDPLVEALRQRISGPGGLREKRRWTQDDLASFLQAAGIPWTRATVTNFENGIRRLSPTEWFALLSVLRIGETDLFPEGVKLTEGLAGGPKEPGQKGFLAGIVDHEETDEDLEKAHQMLLQDQEAGVQRLLDERAAEALSEALRRRVSWSDVATAARRLWRSSLTQERNRRVQQRLERDGRTADPTALARYRGWVTRELVAELRDELGKARNRAAARRRAKKGER